VIPGKITKSRDQRIMAITPEIQANLDRREKAKVPGCDLIFHNEGHDSRGNYLSKLDAQKHCPQCGKKWAKKNPKYIGRLLHDFRRSCAYETWKAGSSVEDCMKLTGHKTASMFKRYADPFSEEEERARQHEVQQRRQEWRKSQALDKVVEMPKRAAVQ
jgi:hypothetical protein